MSSPRPKRAATRRPHDRAIVFAALGDPTRLALVGRLAEGASQSITSLTEGSSLTRQAITKHLRVLEDAGVVHGTRVGRESQFALSPEPLADARSFLGEVSARWDAALGRLRALVEDG